MVLLVFLEFYLFYFSNLRLVRVKELTDAHEAMDLSGFKYFTTKHIEQARQVLKNNWYPTIQNIFLSASNSPSNKITAS